MGRDGYCDFLDGRELGLWRARVASAIRGRRGQKLLTDLRAGLDAMPERKLIAGYFQAEGGERCALGVAADCRGVDLSDITPEDLEEDPDSANEVVADRLNVAECLVREIEFINDEVSPPEPARRWQRVRDWVEGQIIK